MKARFIDILAIAVLAGTPRAAAAQQAQPTLPRADAWGSFGWQHAHHDDENSFRTRGSRPVLLTAGGGVYWSPHLRLEVDSGTPTRDVLNYTEHTTVGTVQRFEYAHVIYDRWSLAAAQTYEFLPNAWFNPYVGLGLEMTRQTRKERVDSLFEFDTTSRPPPPGSTHFEPTHEDSSERRTRVSPFAALGFKSYVSRRAFFRTDARVAVHSGVDGVLIRFGFGVDF